MKAKIIFLLCLFCQIIVNAQVVFTSSKLPIVIINTLGNTIVDEPKTIAHISIINNTGINFITDVPNDLSAYIGIEFRGSSSQYFFPKKSFGIELRDSNDNNVAIKKSMLGMPPESDWILYAPYTDKTFFRDVLSHSLANAMRQYSPKCKFVELVIDGQYLGIYVAEEKIMRGNDRVNISKILPTDTSGINITGGYILKIDKTTGAFNGSFPSNISSYAGNPKNINFQYQYPSAPNVQQSQYIQSYIDSFETALLAPNWQDSNFGYRKFINVNSFIDFFLLNELGNNVDGYRLSTYLHKKRSTSGDGKLHMGPVWDFNLAYGNADYCDGWRTDSWAFEQPCDGSYYPFWWHRLLKDATYTQQLKCRYNNYRTNLLSTANIFANIDSMVQYIDTAATNRNYTAWPIIGTYIWPNFFVGNSYAQEIDSLKSFISQRLIWMDANMPGTCLLPIANQNIELFTAKQQDKNVVLQWRAMAENGTIVEVEKSKDALFFTNIATTTLNSTNNVYKTTDEEPYLGKNYYRLKYVSGSGIISYSNVIQFYFSHNKVFQLYPTFCADNIQLITNAITDNVQNLEIYNAQGVLQLHQLLYIKAGSNNFCVSVAHLPSGVYYAICKTNNAITNTLPFYKN